MSAKTETRIAIRPTPDGPTRKLTKITAYKDGGFAVVMPYHRARSGFLAKLPVDYTRRGDFMVPFADVTGFTADDRIKLSYHADGFAQFSGEVGGKIISGREADGTIKGVGLMTSPLANPISTGPTFGIVTWGLDDFEELTSGAKALVFDENDFYHRGCPPAAANGWVLEAFVFPAQFWAGVQASNRGYVLRMSFRHFEAPNSVIEMKVIELPGQDAFIAAFVSRLYVEYQARSGWVLNGPGTRDMSGRGEVINAFYPRDTLPVGLVGQANAVDRSS